MHTNMLRLRGRNPLTEDFVTKQSLFASGNLDERNLAGATGGSLIREDVMEKIWLIDRFPLPLTDLCIKDTSGNAYKEFTVDELGAQDLDNAQIDGSDQTQNNTVIGNRQGSWHQTSTKVIQVSTRANATRSIGRQGSLSYQVSRGQQRLRRDVEGIMLKTQASRPGDADTQASLCAGLPSWIKTNAYFGVGGSAGGFNATTRVVDAPTHGTKRALTETLVRDMLQAIYQEGGDAKVLMSQPAVHRKFSEYLFTAAARIATQYNPDQKEAGSTAYGSHSVFVSDFAVVRMQDNRLQPGHAAGESTLYGLDGRYLRQSMLTGYRTEPLAKTGLMEKRLISVDYCLLVTNEKSQGMISDIDNAAEVTFS